MLRALGVIPARYDSTRFRGKPLALLAGRPLIEHVWRNVARSERVDRVVVATDDRRIADACVAFGADVAMTSRDHPSGTDRVAEVVGRSEDRWDVVVNVQGDEPLVTPESLDRLVAAFDRSPPPEMATLVEPMRNVDDVFDPNVVKVVTDGRGRALYFSRSPIPFHRGDGDLGFREALNASPGVLDGYLKHQGIYAFTPESLLALTRLPPSPLERLEALEQLRALQAGFVIRVVESDFVSVGVDTPADLDRVEARLRHAAHSTEESH